MLGLPELIALKALGFEEIGVCVGVWLKGMYFWPVVERPSIPAGLLRECCGGCWSAKVAAKIAHTVAHWSGSGVAACLQA